jgi:CDGSH-type Zn-finger protein/uncharacterized Fe-S cluster protein YjdI
VSTAHTALGAWRQSGESIMAGTKTFESDAIRVHFDARRCIHARKCVLGLPGVFRVNERPWIQSDGAPVDELAAVIRSCPSGALSYERKDGGSKEAVPAVNQARLWEHGPIEVHGDLTIAGEPAGTRAVLCRCGASKRKPWCDNTHLEIAFKATGEARPEAESVTLESTGGALRVTPSENGPNHVEGNLEIVAGSGREIACTTDTWLCRCGASANKPFCDGSHKKIGFTAEGG